MQITVTVNGSDHTVDVEPRMLLSDLLRNNLRLTGTNIGCDTSQCGSCTVHFNGEAVKSCTLLAVQADGAEITTIEGLEQNGELHPMQKAFWDQHGLQCGFCTPGMIMTAIRVVETNQGELTDETIRKGLYGNMCRCTGYQNIVRAVQQAAEEMQGGSQ